MLNTATTHTQLPSLSSSHPFYSKAHLRRDDPEFDFWATACRSFPSPGTHGGKEEDQDQDVDDMGEKLESEFCFPLQKHRRRSSLSNLQAIAEGRKQLMELAGEMAESNLELSLKDIVNHKPSPEGDRVEVVGKGGSFHFAKDKQSIKKKKEAVVKSKSCVVTRSRSFDTGAYLIKMFSPSHHSSWKPNPKSSPPPTHRSLSKEGSGGSSSSHGSSETTSRSSSCSSSSTTTRLRRRKSVASSTSFLDCLTCLPSLCAGGTYKSKQRSRECMF